MNLLDEPQEVALAVRKPPDKRNEEMMSPQAETHLNEIT